MLKMNGIGSVRANKGFGLIICNICTYVHTQYEEGFVQPVKHNMAFIIFVVRETAGYILSSISPKTEQNLERFELKCLVLKLTSCQKDLNMITLF